MYIIYACIASRNFDCIICMSWCPNPNVRSPKLRDAVLSDIKASSPATDAESCAASQSWEAAVTSVQGVRDELLQALDAKEV